MEVGAISWRSIKQKCFADSTIETKYFIVSEAAKEAVWLRNFLMDLDVVPFMPETITLYCDNSRAVANSKEPQAHKMSKHIERRFHFIRLIVRGSDKVVTKVASVVYLVDLFTKSLLAMAFDKHVKEIRCMVA